MTPERKAEMYRLADAYNRARGPGYVPPYIAMFHGVLEPVAKDIGVPSEELEEFLTEIEPDLPQDHLIG
jgi:hypothetical protein